MAIIKVANALFSPMKSLEKALKKCHAHDDIHVAPAHYKETLHCTKSVQIYGQQRDEVIIEGAIIIPAASEVKFTNVTIHPSAHIHIEGTAHFDSCTLIGTQTNAIMSLANGHVTMKNCHVEGAKDVAIAAFKDSHIAIDQCSFTNNGKTHLLLDRSSGSITKSEFTKSTHALWLKNDASLVCQNNDIRHQYGTQVIVQHSTYKDAHSTIQNSVGNGLFASKQAYVELQDCQLRAHTLPQIWIQDSEMHCTRTYIEHGEESGLTIRDNSNVYLTLCTISDHKIANIQLSTQSCLHLQQTTVQAADGIGLQAREKSVVHISNSTFAKNKMAQIYITDQAVLSMHDTTIIDGLQVGLIVENNASCTMLKSTIKNQLNSGLTVIDADCTIIESMLMNNNGNGALALNNSTVVIEQTYFEGNKMPHIGAKNYAQLSILLCQFEKGKALYLVKNAHAQMEGCQLLNGDGVQIELNDHAKGTFAKCQITNGKTNAMKLLRNSSAHISECIIAKHKLPQIVANDSSFVLKNSEIIDGERNGFIIENHAEAHIEETFIARHRYPQIWVDLNSNVELVSVQLTEGTESDLYLQNESSLLAIDSFIKNLSFTYNIQSINFSKIKLQNTVIEHFSGNCFYTENNSEIIASMDDNIENEKN